MKNTNKVQIENYMNNNQHNAMKVITPLVTLYFSYQTIVAFVPWFGDNKGELIVSENVWSNTTGKHLNEIDGGMKKLRKPHAEFTRLLDEVMTPL